MVWGPPLPFIPRPRELVNDGERVIVFEDEQDLRRERIETFARLLVDAYGFEGDEAERERKKIVRTLDKNRDPIHYVRLQRRAKRQVQESDLRRMVAEAGLPDHELEAVLRESIRRVSQSARDRSARTDEPRSR